MKSKNTKPVFLVITTYLVATLQKISFTTGHSVLTMTRKNNSQKNHNLNQRQGA